MKWFVLTPKVGCIIAVTPTDYECFMYLFASLPIVFFWLGHGGREKKGAAVSGCSSISNVRLSVRYGNGPQLTTDPIERERERVSVYRRLSSAIQGVREFLVKSHCLIVNVD